MTDLRNNYFESDPELHRLCMRNLTTYADQYNTANPRPHTSDDERWKRRLKGEPPLEPLTTDEQERLVLTLMTDELFRVAMRGALNV